MVSMMPNCEQFELAWGLGLTPDQHSGAANNSSKRKCEEIIIPE
jgi:hypothetical protein